MLPRALGGGEFGTNRTAELRVVQFDIDALRVAAA
jgi:hypothetical protein